MTLNRHSAPWLLMGLAGVVAIASAARVTSSPQAAGATPTIVTAAQAFLTTLNEADRAKVVLAFDSRQRAGWSNLPEPMFHRNGLRLGDMTPPQRAAALALVAAALSRDGYRKVTEIMNGDEVLKNGAGARQGAPRAGGPRFGADEYYLAFLGTPSATAPWMLQFGGHHLAINVTVAGPANVMTPSLPAAQPARYTLNGETIRPLGRENDKGFALINALTAEQQKQAILPYDVRDLVLGPGADGKTIQPEGIPGSALTAAQQAMLLDLAHEWVGILNDEGAAAEMAEIKGNMARTYFAWSGPTTNGSVMYYRIQGPTVVIEYAPQRSVDHIHTIYRDPTNDYGARIVK